MCASSSKICKLLDDYFSSVDCQPMVHAPMYANWFPPKLVLMWGFEWGCPEKACFFRPNKGTGSDYIPPIVLKHCSKLTVLINDSIKFGVFPDGLKIICGPNYNFITPKNSQGHRWNQFNPSCPGQGNGYSKNWLTSVRNGTQNTWIRVGNTDHSATTAPHPNLLIIV